MTRPAFIAELLDAAEKAKEGRYSVTVDYTDWEKALYYTHYVGLSAPANILELARYIEELEAGNEKLKEALKPSEKLLEERIRDYLFLGGVFNPELADNIEVRDLLLDFRDYLKHLRRAAALGEKP